MKSCLFICFISIRLLWAQSPLWEKGFGGQQEDRLFDGISCLDGSTAWVGSIASHAQSPDMWLIKLDGEGKVVWEQIYGRGFDETAVSVVQTADGGFAILGNIAEAGNSRIWLLKTDVAGNVVWEKRWGTGKSADVGLQVISGIDGGYLVTGIRKSEHEQPVWIAKLDEQGGQLWEKTWNGARPLKLMKSDKTYWLVSEVARNQNESQCRLLQLSPTGFPLKDFTVAYNAQVQGATIATPSQRIYLYGSQKGQGFLGCINGNGKHLWQRLYGQTTEIADVSPQAKSMYAFAKLPEKSNRNEAAILKLDKKGKLLATQSAKSQRDIMPMRILPIATKTLMLGAQIWNGKQWDWWVGKWQL